MLFVYQFILENRSKITHLMLKRIPREVKSYARIPRPQLKELVDHLLDGLLELVAANQSEKLRSAVHYLVRKRLGQGESLSAFIQSVLTLGPILRGLLQDEIRDLEYDGPMMFNKAMTHIDRAVLDTIAICIDAAQEQLRERAPDAGHTIETSNFLVLRA